MVTRKLRGFLSRPFARERLALVNGALWSARLPVEFALVSLASGYINWRDVDGSILHECGVGRPARSTLTVNTV